MVEFKLKNLPKNTFEILATIPQSTIEIETEKAFIQLTSQLELEGFRKGKVPKEIARKHLKQEEIYQKLIKDLLPKIYQELISKNKLQPIVNPKIELVKAKADDDWQVKFTLAVKPTVELKDYKKMIQNAKNKGKKANIWIPGKSPKAKPNPEQEKQKLLNQILETLLKEVKLEIADLVIEDELNRRLSQLLDDIKKIGLTVDGYLKSKNLTMEQLKERYTREINDTYKLEFILQEIADKEVITVDKTDLDKLFSGIKDEEERKTAEQNAYFYASILRKQKTLEFLASL